MIGLIRSIFGIARPKRSESEEATSKGKVFQDPCPRRTNSRDSKLRLETARKEPRPESLFDSDEVYTIKKNRPASIRRPVRESLNLDLISDLGDGNSSRECELLSEVFENHSDKEFSSRVFPQTECSFRQRFHYAREEIISEELVQSIQSKQKGEAQKSQAIKRILGKNVLPRRRFKPKLKCPFCDQPMELQESLQLACTHRYHERCMIKMRMRNRFECDICEIRKQNRVSMGMLDRKRQRGSSFLANL